VRCAVPRGAQRGLARQPRLYAALEELHANHLGTYVDVVEPGEIRVGDEVAVA
jgi:MOSC domain-containing protein YiiM